MTTQASRSQAAMIVYGVSVVCAIVVVRASVSHAFNVYDVFEAASFGAITSVIPWGFLYARRFIAAFAATFILNFFLVTQAIAPTATGIAMLGFLAVGVAYMLAPIRDAVLLFFYKRKKREQPHKPNPNA